MKNKVILIASCLFSLLFLGYVFKLSDEIQKDEEHLEASPNIKDVTDKIQTKILVTKENLSPEVWGNANFNGLDWTPVKIPSHTIVQDPAYSVGGHVYYSILIPKNEIDQLGHLKGELDLGLQTVSLGEAEVYVNGKFLRKNTPKNYAESMLNIPLESGKDNVVSIKGYLKEGDRGIEHRRKIYLGKSAELSSIYSFSYRGSVVFPLIFVLCKGSVIFVFALIYLLLNVGNFFEKSLVFSLCAVGEDILAGDFLTPYFNLNVRAYMHNAFSLGTTVFLFLFLADVIGRPVKKKNAYIASGFLCLFSFLMMSDVLYKGLVFDFSLYLKFWIYSSVGIILYFLPKTLKIDKVLSSFMGVTISLTVWSSIVGPNVGMNLKLFGNLLLFFMVAYQSFALFRKEQLDREAKTIQLIEQEKDVAIGKTASLLAHDVRRPLEQAKLILDKVLNGEVSEEFVLAAKNDVNFSLSSVNNQINDIMNFTKTKAPELLPISFHQVLSSSIKQVMAVQKNVDLSLNYDLKASHQILGDEGRLASALTNLISNAVEAIRDIGKKTSGTIRFESEERNGKFLFRIINDGPAIPSEAVDNIWKPKFTMGKSNGTGLGLSSVQKSLTDHRGSISVKNLSNGVEFELTFELSSKTDSFPLATFRSHSRDYSYEVKTDLESSKRPLRIFVFDKDQQVHDYFRSLMKNLPFHVDLVCLNHVEMAQTAIKNKRYDFYILENDSEGLKLKELIAFAGEAVVMHTQKPMSFEDLHSKAEALYKSRPKMLIVDDGELTLMSWEMFHGKHNVRTAISPESALKILETENDFKLCVVDYYYDNSSMTGLDLAQILKTKGLKVVISSNANLETSLKTIDKTHYEVRDLI